MSAATMTATQPTTGAAQTKPHGPLRRALALSKPNPWQLTLAVLLGVLTIGASVGLGAASAWLILRASQMPPVLALYTCSILVRVFGISRGVLRYLERLASHRVALRGMTELRTGLYERLAAGKASATAFFKHGDLMARVGADVEAVGDLVVRGIVPLLVAAVLSVASSLFIGYFVPLAGVTVFCCLLAAGVLGPVLTIRSARIAEIEASNGRTRVAAASLTVLEHADELAVGGRLGRARADLEAGERELYSGLDHAARPSGLAAAINELAVGVCVIACTLLTIPLVRSGALATTEMAIVVLTPLSAFEAVTGLPAAAQQLYRSRTAAARVLDLLDAAGPDAAPSGAAAPDVVAHVAAEGSREVASPTRASSGIVHPVGSGPLVATGLTCGWVPSRPVLEGIDLQVAPGRTLGVLGPSGIGKTTLLGTLAGLVPPLAGTVTVDGRRIDQLTREEAASAVAFIAEDAHIFATTVLENLRVVDGTVDEERAREALAAAGLQDWLAGLPEGLDQMLGQGGSTVSGGERRRLLLARALLSPARFLLIDEPGEHLDDASAEALTAGLIAAAHHTGRGLVVVTHQPAGLATADDVLRLG